MSTSTAILVNDNQIYERARDCESLFWRLLTDETVDNEPVEAKNYHIIREYHQRFQLWTAFVGVFAQPEASLDARLRDHPQVHNLVLRLLQLLQSNLARFNSSLISNHSNQALPEPVAAAALDAIHEAIERLQRLASIIRQSSMGSWASRVKAYALKVDPEEISEFERIALLFVKGRLDGVSESLAEQLASSITFRRLKLLYVRRHHQKLATPRQYLPSVGPNSEPNPSQADIRVRIPVPASQAHHRLGSSPLYQPIYATSQTSPSVLDQSRFQKEISKPASVLDNATVSLFGQGYSYPPRPKIEDGLGFCKCQWCACELKTSDLEKHGWWRAHFQHDLEPYVCISEECIDNLRYFSKLSEWREHMEEAHSKEWAQKIHNTVWYCDVEPGEYAEFPTGDKLREHIKTRHSAMTESRVVRKVTRNILRVTRNANICPLCNQDVLAVYELQSRITQAPSKGKQAAENEDVEYSFGGNDTQQHDSPKSPGDNRPSFVDYAKMVKHVAQHLKSLAFISIRYIDDDNISVDSDQAASGQNGSTEEGSDNRLFGDTPDDEGPLQFEDIPSDVRANAQSDDEGLDSNPAVPSESLPPVLGSVYSKSFYPDHSNEPVHRETGRFVAAVRSFEEFNTRVLSNLPDDQGPLEFQDTRPDLRTYEEAHPGPGAATVPSSERAIGDKPTMARSSSRFEASPDDVRPREATRPRSYSGSDFWERGSVDSSNEQQMTLKEFLESHDRDKYEWDSAGWETEHAWVEPVRQAGLNLTTHKVFHHRGQEYLKPPFPFLQEGEALGDSGSTITYRVKAPVDVTYPRSLALKVIVCRSHDRPPGPDSTARRSTLQALSKLSRIQHPHVVVYVASFEDYCLSTRQVRQRRGWTKEINTLLTSQVIKRHIFGVAVYPPAQTNLQVLLEDFHDSQTGEDSTRKSDNTWMGAYLCSYFGCLTRAMLYLWNSGIGIQYSDINLRKILIDDFGLPVIGTIGLTRHFETPTEPAGRLTKYKTPYIPPETDESSMDHPDSLTLPGLVYSLGCIFFEITSVLLGLPRDNPRKWLGLNSHNAGLEEPHWFTYRSALAGGAKLEDYFQVLRARQSNTEKSVIPKLIEPVLKILPIIGEMLEVKPEKRPHLKDLYPSFRHLYDLSESPGRCESCEEEWLQSRPRQETDMSEERPKQTKV